MLFLHKYPYTDFNEYNLDWVIRTIKEIEENLSEWEVLHEIIFGGVWSIDKNYKAWTIVTEQESENGYISLKNVPAGIDITNTTYWLKIANYSSIYGEWEERIRAVEQEIDELREDVEEDLAEVLQTVETEIAEMQKDVPALARKRKIIIFGDSYFMDTPAGGVTLNFKTALGIYLANTTGIEVEVHADGGEGFAQSGTYNFLYDIQNYESDFDADEVTDIFFVGGYNDAGYSIANIEAGIYNCVSACKQKYKNAKVSVGHFGWSGTLSGDVRTALVNNSIPAYKNAGTCGAGYMLNSEFTMHNYDLFITDDRFHPNADGVRQIAKQIMLYILSGSCDVHYGYRRVEFNGGANAAWNTQTPYSVGSKLDNDRVSIFWPDTQIVYDDDFDLDPTQYIQMLQLTTVAVGHRLDFIGNYDAAPGVNFVIPLKGFIQYNTTSFAGLQNMQCIVNGGFLKVRNYNIAADGSNFEQITNINSIKLIGGQFSIPTLEC